MTGTHFSKISILTSMTVGLAFGAIFMAVGIWTRSSTQPIDGGVTVSAEVVEVRMGSNSDGNTTYTPIVDYVDPATGRTHRLPASFSSSSRPDLGDAREVSLVPGDPSTARVVGPSWFSWAFIGVGAFAMLGAFRRAVKGFGGGPSVADGAAWTDNYAPQIFQA